MEDERKAILKLLHSSNFKTLLQSEIKKVLKDNQQSELLRQTGNTSYKKAVHDSSSHDGAWQFYSMSIARAESNTENLAMSYGNRSAILLHLSKYEACIRDIDRGLGITRITENNSLKIKLLLRKAKCLHLTGSKDDQSVLKEADLLLNKITDDSVKKSCQVEIDKVKVMLKKPVVVTKAPTKDVNAKALKNLNKKHRLNDFSLLRLKFNEKYGRHLVAAKDIRPGEVIYIEKPYVQFVNLLKMHAYCINCFKTAWDNIPCDHCCWAMFCSEQCKQEAWEKYHEIECAVYSDFKLDTKDSFNQLALRILSRALKQHGSVENLKAELASFDDCIDYENGFMHNGKLRANGLKSIYFLCKNVPANSLPGHAANTAKVLRSFGRNTSFFGKDFDYTNVESYKKNENAIFIGSLFLRLRKISQLNNFQMWNRSLICENWSNERDCVDTECCTPGTFIAPITGLLNHDCFPNSGLCYTPEYTVVAYAIAPIKRGAQIFTSYLKIFSYDNLPYRRKLLSETYDLQCDCFSCQNDLESGLKRIDNDLPTFFNVARQPMDMLDLQLSLEYKDVLPGAVETAFQQFDCERKTIGHLRRGLERVFALKRVPAVTTSSLVAGMQIAFDKLYGLKLEVPSDCNDV